MATKVKTAKNYRKDITKSVGIIHDEIINISGDVVEGTLTAAQKWQKLWAKAIKNSEPMMSKQMDMVYSTLYGVKGQIKVGGKRIKELLNKEGEIEIPSVKKTAKKAAAKARKTVKKTAAKTKSTVKAATKTAAKKTAKRKTTVKAATKTSAKKKATVKRTAKKTLKADKLQLIEGVGPKLEAILRKNGITTFKQLAKTKVTTLRTILEKAGPRYNIHNPSTWAQQAKFAAAGKFSDLVKFQASLNKKK